MEASICNLKIWEFENEGHAPICNSQIYQFSNLKYPEQPLPNDHLSLEVKQRCGKNASFPFLEDHIPIAAVA
jgi:hypothetical protein